MNTKPAPDSGDWERLWFATRHKSWSSLAIIPIDGSVDSGAVAESLVATGRLHGERPVSLLDARGVPVNGVRHLVDSLNVLNGRGNWVIVPVDPISENPSSVPIVQATSGALLVVRLGGSLLASGRAAIDAVGREHFLGSIVIGGGKGAGSLQLTPPQ